MENTKFHDYTEAQSIVEIASKYGIKIRKNMTFDELCDKLDEKCYVYCYSSYKYKLLEAVAEDIAILEIFEELYDEGITSSNIQYINGAIYQLIRENYGDKTLDYFVETKTA